MSNPSGPNQALNRILTNYLRRNKELKSQFQSNIDSYINSPSFDFFQLGTKYYVSIIRDLNRSREKFKRFSIVLNEDERKYLLNLHTPDREFTNITFTQDQRPDLQPDNRAQSIIYSYPKHLTNVLPPLLNEQDPNSFYDSSNNCLLPPDLHNLITALQCFSIPYPMPPEVIATIPGYCPNKSNRSSHIALLESRQGCGQQLPHQDSTTMLFAAKELKQSFFNQYTIVINIDKISASLFFPPSDRCILKQGEAVIFKADKTHYGGAYPDHNNTRLIIQSYTLLYPYEYDVGLN